MRYLSFITDGKPQVGFRQGKEVISLTELLSIRPTTMSDLIAIPALESKIEAAMKGGGKAAKLSVSSLTYRPAVENPGKFICLGLNYKDHAAELDLAQPDFPIIFLRGATSLTGHKQPIIRPKVSDHLDFEAELVVIIGKPAHYVDADKAMDHVFGFSCFNDASIRDYQRKTPQITTGKNFDRTGGFGPEIVTRDELPRDPDKLNIECRLNGKVMQRSNTDQHVFGVPEAIHILSSLMTLEPGDVIAFGTPGGVGMARKPELWMKPGDVCEIEIEGIGCLQNTVEDE